MKRIFGWIKEYAGSIVAIVAVVGLLVGGFSAYSSVEREQTAKIADLTADLSGVSSKLDAVILEHEDLNGRFGGYDAKFTTLEVSLGRLEERVAGLQTDINDLSAGIREIKEGQQALIAALLDD